MKTEKTFTLNGEQKAAAFCEESAVIAAGAGSGKTMVLASRYVWLITKRKFRVREILTLTFTKKAVAQMYSRIHIELAKKAKEDSGEEGELAQKALDEFAQARIQTLDSYSSSIVRQAANRYGIKPDYAIDEELCRQIAVEEALPFVIANRGHPVLDRLYAKKNPELIAKNIFAQALFRYTHIDTEIKPLNDIKKQFAIVCSEWKKQTDFLREKLEELAQIYPGNEKNQEAFEPLLEQYNSGSVIFPEAKELHDFFNNLVSIPPEQVIEWTETHPLQGPLKNILDFIVLINRIDLRSGKPRDNPVKTLIREIKESFGEFSSMVVFCRQAGLIYCALELLSDLQKIYQNRKRAEGILTFNDTAILAKKILLEQPDIRQSEKDSFKAIIIDEFQDNNELQKDLLFLLAEKENIFNESVPPPGDLADGKLFFVGDEKQSIYRFRGADVSVFRKLKNELGSMDLPLSKNYRSAPELIGAFNTIFGGYEYDPLGFSGDEKIPDVPGTFCTVFAPEPELPLFEASYSPLRSDKKTKGKLTLCILDEQDSQDTESDEEASENFSGEEDSGDNDSRDDNNESLPAIENEARYVAEKIKILLTENKYKPENIAILFHSRSPQQLFEKHLLLLNIPYTSENLDGFFYGGPVNDIMSVLRLAAYPSDRAAYAQMLRSPFAGLSIPGLAICLTAMDSDSDEPFGCGPIPNLTEEDREKYIHGQKIHKKITEKTCTESICSLIDELWYGEGYRYETEWNPVTSVYRELYDYLYHLAVLADEKNIGLAAFTNEVLELEKSGERLSDIEIPLERPGAVHLTTIHKSKGLEFPVVFLCCCGRKGRKNYGDDIYETDGAGLTLNPPLPSDLQKIKYIKKNYFWERSLTEENAKRTAELRRLLYVGMTRAESELYLTGSLGITKSFRNKSNKFEISENFTENFKHYIDFKTKEKKTNNTIPNDTILNGSSFFGLSLPAFGSHISIDGTETAIPFFNIEQIPVYDDQHIQKTEHQNSRFTNDLNGLSSFFKIVNPLYEKAEIIKTPDVPITHYTPTSLPAGTDLKLSVSFIVDRDNCGESSEDIFAKVDKLLDRYAERQDENGEKFNNGSFGTIAHICAEALLSGKEAEIPAKMAGVLSETDAEGFLTAGKELAFRFVKSPLGIKAKNSGNRKSEFMFRSLAKDSGGNEIFINGTIDLVFEDTQTVYVVDFKTDREENPALHITQMSCYLRAASDLFANPSKKPCRVLLYYLRSGNTVDVTPYLH